MHEIRRRGGGRAGVQALIAWVRLGMGMGDRVWCDIGVHEVGGVGCVCRVELGLGVLGAGNGG